MPNARYTLLGGARRGLAGMQAVCVEQERVEAQYARCQCLFPCDDRARLVCTTLC
ncbi:hypothetical protein FOMPIDRAFT_1025913 [Fomitopsis schrenkii]|uniref:Uncharacterized protein n=1 Tax=Fomitopsis schrenkii TaxID=2126942 RepID=S8DVC1_FOMSC|nr:hypothetical protein FOMPIDRAFT_1025913 [Fomitopsis schrenkii]